MQIPQDVIDKILDINIVDEINEDVTLRKTGANYVGLCPFHTDKSPSMYVSPSKRIWSCFVCNEGGNIIKWRMKLDSVSFPEACRDLGKRHNIEIPEKELSEEEQKKIREYESFRAVAKASQECFVAQLKNPVASAYLKERNITAETAKLYGLGYCSDIKELEKKGYDEERMLTLNILGKSENRTYPFFVNRILFPFYDRRGNIIAWSGRDITGKAPAKYKNTGDTPLFKKGNNLYGYYQAKKSAVKLDRVYVVEGQFDVLSMAQNGVTNVVAGSGTAFTDAQRNLLKCLTMNVTFIYDGDKAGVKAASKNLIEMVKDGFKVRCIALPDGQDPDDMAKALGDRLSDYVSKAEGSYVKFLGEHSFSPKMDEFEKLAETKAIVKIIAHESEEIIKNNFLSELTTYCGYSLQDLQSMLDEVSLPEKKEKFEDGFVGIEECKELVNKDDPEIHLTNSFEIFLRKFGEKKPYIFYQGIAPYSQFQELQQVSEHVIFENYDFDCSARSESSDCRLMKQMFQFGFKIELFDGDGYKSFINHYINHYAYIIGNDSGVSVEDKNEIILKIAEMISYAKETVRTISMEGWAKVLGLKTTALKEIVKPYVNERKSKAKIQRDTAIDEDILMNTERIPDYVEENEKYSKMLQQFSFYPLINKDGMPVCYMFRTDNGSFKRVADFYMEPLLHVYSKNKEENKRIIRLNSLVTRQSHYVEWPSTVFTKLNSLSEALFNEGSFNFFQGTSADYEKIRTCLSYEFTRCVELKTFGQQQEGFFCFANAIFHQIDGDWRIEMADELGIMTDNDDKYYSPAFSKINAGARKDDDEYEQVRNFIYKEVPQKDQLSFKEWAQLMDEVYKVNDNGKWALLYSIISAFRSEIHPIHRWFTTLFFMGPTGSGKTQIAVSARSIFMTSDVPCDNLNSMSDAAFFSKLEKFRDVPVVFEEYNDDEISDIKFQGLKQIVYDGDGKTKRKSASTNDVETSKVNSPVVLLGQFAPSKDDGSLCNRIILLEVPVRNDRSDHETDIFNKLKYHEKKGLSNILLEILKLRPIVKKYFESLLDETIKEMKAEMKQRGKIVDLRLINTNSLFIAFVKLMKQHAQHLELPFTLEEFKEISIKKVIEQSDILKQTDKLAMFFSRIDTLINKGIVKQGREFKVVTIDKPYVALKDGEIPMEKGTRLLYVNMKNIYDYYSGAGSLNGEKPMKLSDLNGNLHSHPAYVGAVSNTRFAYTDVEEVPINRELKDDVDADMTGKSMTVVREMVKKEIRTSAVVLNYDILEQMGICWLRDYKNQDNNTKKEDEFPF